MTCPFCGQKEIYVYPATQERPWWVVGCQSIVCDSTWHIDKNCGETVLAMFEKCQPPPKCEWEYSHYRATLKRKGKTFAIVTPDGKNSLNPFDAFVLLKALNGSKPKPPNDGAMPRRQTE